MNFIKTFLAGLLAVVVGTFLVFFLWIFILLGIAGSMEKSFYHLLRLAHCVSGCKVTTFK